MSPCLVGQNREQLKGSYFGWACELVISLQARLFFAFKYIGIAFADLTDQDNVVLKVTL